MKKTDFYIEPDCVFCGCPAVELHEIIGGRSAKRGTSKRDICIQYDLQVPICRRCHQQVTVDKCCDILGIDSSDLIYAVEKNLRKKLKKLRTHMHERLWYRCELRS